MIFNLFLFLQNIPKENGDQNLIGTSGNLDQNHVHFEKENSIKDVQLAEYKNSLIDRNYVIESLQTDIRYYQHTYHNLSNRLNRLMER